MWAHKLLCSQFVIRESRQAPVFEPPQSTFVQHNEGFLTIETKFSYLNRAKSASAFTLFMHHMASVLTRDVLQVFAAALASLLVEWCSHLFWNSALRLLVLHRYYISFWQVSPINNTKPEIYQECLTKDHSRGTEAFQPEKWVRNDGKKLCLRLCSVQRLF